MTTFTRSVLVIFLMLGTLSTYHAIDVGSVERSDEQSRISDEQREKILKVARSKASQLGYRLENLDTKFTKEKGLSRIDFYPRQKKERVVFGGSLTVFIDMEANIVSYEEGW